MEAYFDYVIASQQITRSEPDLQARLEALYNIDLTAEERIVSEDTENGVMTACNAGIDVIVVNDKERRKYSDILMAIHDFGDYRLYQEL